MGTFLHGGSRHMYSWWWDSHISPKNSKWLQENLTDMDRNIKSMIKLIEEDADSFARRAEMYYKKRPELMKLVEEFYRAYRALAERYDHATGALRQAHRTMAEAFPNQIPSTMSDWSPSSSGADIGPHTPEMAPPMRALLDLDDLHKDVLGVSSHFNGRRINGAYSEESNSLSAKKGLKQLIPSGEGKVRKVLSFKDEIGGRVEETVTLKNEIRHLQEDVSQLTTKNESLMSLMSSASQHARALEETISKLESMKEAAIFQYNLSIERISSLENDIFNTRCELNEVNDEMVVKLNSVGEQCLELQKVNRSLQLELETQQRELQKRGKELEALNTSIEAEHQKRMQAEVALMSLEQIHMHSQEEAELLVLEIQRGGEKLKDMELSKVGLEGKITELKEIIGNLHEQNTLSGIKIKDLQDEMKLLKETKEKLEHELGAYQEENRALQREVCGLKEGNKDLEQRHQGLTEQIEVVSEKNVVLENSLLDANVELEGLKDKVKALEASFETLLGVVSTHVVEKGQLVSQLENISQSMESVSEKNSLLENSLSDANIELEGLRARFKDLEQCSMSLCDQNSSLLSEKNTLVSQIDTLESKYFELQNQHIHLEEEKDSKAHQVMELQTSLALEKQDYGTLILSLSSQVASLHHQIHLLKEEIQVKVMDFEVEQQKVMNSLFHIFILQRCLCEMNDKNFFLSGECQNLLQASKHAEEQISQLKHKELMQRKEIKSLSEHNGILNKVIHLLLEELRIDVKHRALDDGTDEELAKIILGEVKKLLNSVSDAAKENKYLQLKVVNLESKYITLLDQHSSLEREKDSTVCQVTELESSLKFKKQEHEDLISSFSSQLTSLKKQVHILEEEIKIKDEDLEVEEEKTIKADLENVVLCRCLCDMKDENLSLSGECQNLLEALKCREERISELNDEGLMQKKELTFLSSHIEILRDRIHSLLDILNVDMKNANMDSFTEEEYLRIVLDEVRNLLSSVSDAQDKNQCLHLEVVNLENKYQTLQDQHSNLKRKNDSTVHQVVELENSLKLKKQEREDIISSFSSQLASLRKQVHLLEEEIRIKDKDLEVEEQKTITAHLENFVLCRCLCDMKDGNLGLFEECQNLLEALRCREKRISELEHEDVMQKKELTLLSSQSKVLRDRIHLLLDVLNIDMKNGVIDECTDEEYLQIILGEIGNLLSLLSDAQDENQCLHLEVLVLATLLKQLGLDKSHLHHELEIQTEEIIDLVSEKHEAMEMNKQLKDENNFLFSQVENTTHSLETLQIKYSELEEKNLNLESVNDSAIHRVSKLESSLNLEKQEHHALKSQFDILQKEKQAQEVEFGMEQQKTMTALLEIFILQRCLCNMKDKNLILFDECQKLLEASKHSDRLISELEHEQIVQNESNEKLRSGILQMLEEFHINKECGTIIDGNKDEVLLQILLGEIKSMLKSISNSWEENQCLHLEISVLVTLLKQIGLEKEEVLKMNEQMKAEMCNLVEENKTSSERSYELKEKLDIMEGENRDILSELLTLDHLFIFFKALSVERGLKLKLSRNNVSCILAVKISQDEEIRLLNKRIMDLEAETMNLKELAILQEFELNIARILCEELNLQIEATENGLSEARWENGLLYTKLEGVNKDLDDATVIRRELEKEIASKDLKITEVIDTNMLLHKELDKSNRDIYKCEGEIETLLRDIYISTVNTAIFEEKVLELIVECESLEILSTLQMEILCEEIALKNSCVDELKKKLEVLEREHDTLKGDFDAYSPVLMTLFDGVECLEEDILSLAKLSQKQDDVASDTSDMKKISNRSMEIMDLQKLISKLKALQNVTKDAQNLLEQERLDSNAKIEATMKEIEELRLKDEIPKEKYGQKIKDIQLDQVSRSCRPKKNENSESDDQMLELWETAERDDIEAIEEVKSEYPSSELIAEKEFSIDKLEVSARVNESSARQWNKKFIQKFDSDTQRLLVAQRSLKELKGKLESNGKKKYAKSLEYDNLKVQVAKAEVGILEQVEAYSKLKKRVEDDLESSNAVIWEERRKVSEEARKGSEKIEKLELEVQKIEYMFLKVEEEEDKKIGCIDRRSSILLSEHIYGKKKDSGRRKGPFCSCMRPKTKG